MYTTIKHLIDARWSYNFGCNATLQVQQNCDLSKPILFKGFKFYHGGYFDYSPVYELKTANVEFFWVRKARNTPMNLLFPIVHRIYSIIEDGTYITYYLSPRYTAPPKFNYKSVWFCKELLVLWKLLL